jgi:hypothetical protein
MLGKTEWDMFLQRAVRASLALVVAAGLASLFPAVISTARSETARETAVGPDALDALARMGKTLSAQQFSFQSRTFRSYAGPNGELLHIAHTTKTIFRRSDRLSVTVTGDDGSIKILYDGQALVLYGAEQKQYASLPVTGGIDRALDLLEERTGTDFPLADLLSDNPAEAVASGKWAHRQSMGSVATTSSLSKRPMIWNWSSGWKTVSGHCYAVLL